MNSKQIILSVKDTGDISDGFHTFNELYAHRIILFMCLMNSYPELSWKSRKHFDGQSYKDWFIAGMNLPSGNITYHIPNKFWRKIKIQELDSAPEWDGHTSDDVLKRLTEWNSTLTSK